MKRIKRALFLVFVASLFSACQREANKRTESETESHESLDLDAQVGGVLNNGGSNGLYGTCELQTTVKKLPIELKGVVFTTPAFAIYSDAEKKEFVYSYRITATCRASAVCEFNAPNAVGYRNVTSKCPCNEAPYQPNAVNTASCRSVQSQCEQLYGEGPTILASVYKEYTAEGWFKKIRKFDDPPYTALPRPGDATAEAMKACEENRPLGSSSLGVSNPLDQLCASELQKIQQRAKFPVSCSGTVETPNFTTK